MFSTTLTNQQCLEAMFAQSLDGVAFFSISPPINWKPSLNNRATVLSTAAHSLKLAVANAAYLSLRGWPDTVIGKVCFEDCLRDGKDAAVDVLGDLFENWTLSRETCEHGKSGELIRVEGHYACLRNEDGDIVGILVTQRDVTLRHHMDLNLRKLSRAVNQSPVSIVITDGQGQIEYVNPKFEQVSGYSLGEVIGRNSSILKSGNTSASDYADLWKTIRQGKVWSGEFHNRNKRGDLYWERATIAPVLDGHGRITNFVGVKEDITAAKLALRDLERSESQFRALFDNLGSGFALFEAQPSDGSKHLDFCVLAVNPAFESLSLRSKEEVVGRKFSEFAPNAYEACFHHLTQVVNNGSQCSFDYHSADLKKWFNISAYRAAPGQVALMLNDITDLHITKRQLEHLAYHDPLTHLPNRTLLSDRIEQGLACAKRNGSSLAVGYLDLDGFKEINDFHGHETGDRLLLDVASRLKLIVRAGDTVSRLGGDEFVLLLSDLPNRDSLQIMADRILAVISAPYAIDGITINISASVGFAVFPEDKVDADTLIRHADQAMYEAKEAGKNRVCFFDTEQESVARSTREIREQVASAIRRGEFVLFYQPKVNMRHGTVRSAEALIRWNHPKRGLLAPNKFLPMLTGTSLLVDLGDWVIKEALGQIRKWSAQGLNLPVSVNVAASQLEDEDFATKLANALKEFPDVPASMLQLEILESEALDDIRQVSAIMDRCHDLGVGFALDDFGTGYSSLTYLKRLRAQTLKIDQSFVRDMLEDPSDLAIVRGIVGLAAAFHREVVAEGVETIEHGTMLMRLGCDIVQGYGIARPMPATEVVPWVKGYVTPSEWADASGIVWGANNYPLLVLRVEHRNWINKVAAAVLSEHSVLPDGFASDHRNCKFGHWFYEAGQPQYGDLPIFRRLGELHEFVHVQADKIMALKLSGNQMDAQNGLDDLIAASRSLIECLDRFQIDVARVGEK